MEETKMTTPEKQEPKKLSYEELENIAKQLSEQNRIMYRQIQEMDLQNTYARLGFLFKVIEFANRFNSDFLSNCVKEIEDLMTIPEDVKPEDTKEITKEDNK